MAAAHVAVPFCKYLRAWQGYFSNFACLIGRCAHGKISVRGRSSARNTCFPVWIKRLTSLLFKVSADLANLASSKSDVELQLQKQKEKRETLELDLNKANEEITIKVDDNFQARLILLEFCSLNEFLSSFLQHRKMSSLPLAATCFRTAFLIILHWYEMPHAVPQISSC